MPGQQNRFVNNAPLHSTLRELHQLSTDPRTWIVLVVLGALVGLVGPFGTYEAMAVLPRLVYWLAIVVGTAAIGTLVGSLLERLLLARMHSLAAALLSGAAGGPPIAAFVALVNYGLFGPDIVIMDLVSLTIYCTIISAGVTALGAGLHLINLSRLPQDTKSTEPPQPALLERLPRPQRGQLLHIAVSDHYVDVTTDKGTTLVLMRLSDAIRETAPIAGLQVHRSHWVALDAVKATRRRDGKTMLELKSGALVPVSRTYLGAVRAAGLLGP